MARVIIGVLSWGLGHATRDLPIIRCLLDHGHHVTVASTGRALQVLKADEPRCEFIDYPDYPMSYSGGRFFMPMFLARCPRFGIAVYRERRQASRMIERGGYDMVLSDGRLSFFHPKRPSFIITHFLKFPLVNVLEVFAPWTGILTSYFYRKFRRTIVPDYLDDACSLTGRLAHGFPSRRSRPYYAGILASVRKLDVPEDVDLFISVSGPEPQRTEFEKIVRAQLPRLPADWNVVVTLGKPDCKAEPERVGPATIYPFFGRERQEEMLNRAKMIVARSGYTTVMELAELGKKALLVPTSGQPEQEHLGEICNSRGLFHCVSQFDLDLLRDVETARSFPGITWKCSTQESVERTYRDLFAPILDK